MTLSKAKWPSTRGRKGHFESPGRVTLPFFSGQVVYLWTLLSDEQRSNKVGVEHQPHIDTLSIRGKLYTLYIYIGTL